MVRRAFFPCVRARGSRRSPRELIGRSMNLKIISEGLTRGGRCGEQGEVDGMVFDGDEESQQRLGRAI